MNTTTTHVRAMALPYLQAGKSEDSLKINDKKTYYSLLAIELIRKFISKLPF